MNEKGDDKTASPNLRWIFWLPAVLAGTFVVVMLAGLVLVSARSLERLTPMQVHLTHIERLHSISLKMEEALVGGLRGGVRITHDDLKGLQDDLRIAEKEAAKTNPGSIGRLRELQSLLDDPDRDPLDILLEATSLLRNILASERKLHDELVETVAHDTRIELKLAVLLLFCLPMITGLTFFLLRHRIKRPLDELNGLLRRLAARDYRPVAVQTVEETTNLVKPVFISYNTLVTRLNDLEAEHRALQLSLEEDIRQATGALLEQARDLARAEKLAAVGELSAALAHEIRNPLAGIQLACTKLGRQLPPEQQQKVDMVVSELKRVNSMLGERLNSARHSPEILSVVDLPELVHGLVSLLKYQVSEGITLHTEVEPNLRCQLPESGLRQALLNLVMNAAGAMGEDGGNITLFARHNGDRVEVGVYDEGPGFPQQLLDGGVRPFVTGSVDGTGLGLAIVQRFTRALSGELILENRPGGGARVTIRLPWAGHTAHRPSASAGAGETSK
ncbi:MAG: ATP-binding protein [Candidatus Thiodiazotropha sp.]